MTDVTSIGDLLLKANEVVPFWAGMLFMIFIILTIMMISFGFEVALLGAGFICFTIGLLLSYAGLVTWQFSMIFLGVVILTILYQAYNKGN